MLGTKEAVVEVLKKVDYIAFMKAETDKDNSKVKVLRKVSWATSVLAISFNILVEADMNSEIEALLEIISVLTTSVEDDDVKYDSCWALYYIIVT